MSDRAERLTGYRHRRDHFFGDHEDSPLNAEQRAGFAGLDYFSARDDLAMNLALDESAADVGETVDIATTDGKTKSFLRAGRVRFAVEGKEVTMTVFRDSDRGSLFIPFRDASAEEDTYEVGRYLEPQSRPDGTLDIDFNYAYNPFCAYGEGWSCPVPPEENRIDVRIAAGERAYRGPDGASPGDAILAH